jgi:hypothetical protein
MTGGFAHVHNGGSDVRSARAVGGSTVTAGGSGDAVAVNTDWVSRKGPLGIANSGKLILSFSAVLAAAATVKFGVQLQDASDINGAGALNYAEAVAPFVAATGGTGGTTEKATAEVDFDLAGAREFVRAVVTPDLSAGATDTLTWSAIYLFFGNQRGFATKSAVNLGSADAI